MPKLLGIAFDNIGHSSARLDGVNIQTSVRGEPKSTVLWLRNGGGKSSIISLVCSVFLPSQNDFATKGEGRTLEGYVTGNGVAVTTTEWTVRGDPSGRTRIIGSAMSRKTSDGGGLRRIFFSFLAGGKSDLLGTAEANPMDSFPVRGLGGRVSSLTEFSAWIRAVDRKYPSREACVMDVQSEWLDFLASRGFEKSEFKLIAAMNRKEGGGSDQILSFKNDGAFVDFVTDSVHDAEAMTSLRNTIVTARQDVIDLGPLKERVAFAEAVTPLLTTFAEHDKSSGIAATASKDARGTAETAASDMDSSAKGYEGKAKALEAETVANATEVKELGLAVDTALTRAGGLRLHGAAVIATDAQSKVHSAGLALEKAKRTVGAAESGRSMTAMYVAQAEQEAAVLAKTVAMEPLQEIRRLLDDATCTFAAALKARRSIVRVSRSDAQASADEAQRQAVGEVKEAAIVTGLAGSERAHEQRTRADADMVAAAVSQMQTNGSLAPNQPVADALVGWQQAVVANEQSLAAATSLVLQATSAVLIATGEFRSADIRRDTAEHQARLLREVTGALEENIATVLSHPAVPLLSDGSDAPGLYENGLVERAAEMAAKFRSTASKRLQDVKAASSIADMIDANEGLLPLSRDTSTVVQGLRDLGMNAHHYARYLAENGETPEAIEARLNSDPARYAGVVIVGSVGFEKARSFKPTHPLATPVQIVASDAPDLPEAQGRIVVGIHPASFDRAVAAAMVEAARRSDAAAQAAAALDNGNAAILDSFVTALNRFLGAYPANKGAELVVATSRADADAGAAREDASRAKAVATEQGFVVDRAKSDVAACTASLKDTTERQNALAVHLALYPKPIKDLLEEAAFYLEQAVAFDERAAEHSGEADVFRKQAEGFRAEVVITDAELTAIDKESRALAYSSNETPEVLPLEQARATYVALLKSVADELTDKTLQERVEATAKAFETADRHLRENMGRFAPHLELTEIDPWRAASDSAIQDSRNLCREAVAAERTLADTAAEAKGALAALRKISTKTMLAEVVEADITLGDALSDAAALEAKAVTDRSRITELETQGRTIETQQMKTLASIETLRAILSTIPNWAKAAVRDSVSKPDLEVKEASEAWAKASKSFEEANILASAALKVAEVSKKKLEKSIRDPAWSTSVEATVRRLIEQIDNGTLAVNVEGNIESIAQFEALARQRLLRCEQSTDEIVDALDVQVSDIRDFVLGMSKASRIPDDASLGAWAGKSFIDVSLDGGDNAEERRASLRSLVVSLCNGGDLPTASALACMALNKTFHRAPRVTMLKPGMDMDTKRYSVSEVMAASGGEKLTAAVLLYSSLKNLLGGRSGRKGGGSMLLLDNPIGSCNLVELLVLQRRVAEACGVQLVFTTALNDYEAVRVFPVLVSMKNEARNARTGERLVEVHESEEERMDMARAEFVGADW